MNGEQLLMWMSDNVFILISFWLLIALILTLVYYGGKVTSLKTQIKVLKNDLDYQIKHNNELLEELRENNVKLKEEMTDYEKIQEEASVISYDELVKVVKGDPKEEEVDKIEVVSLENNQQDLKPKFKVTEAVSPIYGYQDRQDEIKEEEKEDLDEFLSSLVDLRNKL